MALLARLLLFQIELDLVKLGELESVDRVACMPDGREKSH